MAKDLPDKERGGVQLHDGVRSTSVTTEKALVSHSQLDGDEAYAYGAQGAVITPEDNRRLLRKIDWHIQPLLCLVYGIQYLDKTTLSYASIMGLRTQTNLQGQDYSLLGSGFYLGYLVAEFPVSRCLQYFPLAKFTGTMIVLWGCVLTLMAACSNFSGLFAVRFFLGVTESAVTPGFALFTSQWYQITEQGSRCAIWFSFNGVAQIVGGLIAYGLAKADAAGSLAFAGWKVVFVLTGLLTAGFGILVLLYMPDSPVRAHWLSKEDKGLVIERIRINRQGVGNRHFKWHQIKECLTDPLVYLYFLYALIADIPNGGITNFFSTIIVNLGYTEQQSLLYGTPGGAVEVVTIIVFLWLGDRYRMRLFFGACSLSLSLLGIILLYALPDSMPLSRLGGYWLTQASATPFVVILSFIASNVAGYTKKTFVGGCYLIGYCVGNLIGPQVFTADSAPKYTPALITIIVCWCLSIMLLMIMWAYNVRENRRRDRLFAEGGYVVQPNSEFLDLTDRENLAFRYAT